METLENINCKPLVGAISLGTFACEGEATRSISRGRGAAPILNDRRGVSLPTRLRDFLAEFELT